jgi:hypoxia up-regulated 1
VIDGVDFRAKMTREELESISKDLIERVPGPVHSILKDAKLSLNDISSLVLVGGGVRVPSVQTSLTALMGAEKMARNVDGDEAAVFGAVYHAAAVSAQFRTRREIRIKDITWKGVSLKYNPVDSPKTPKVLPLFGPKSRIGAKKLVTFEQSGNFTFGLFYTDSKEPIAKINVVKVDQVLEKYKEKKIKSMKMKGVIEMNESGMLQVNNVYALLEVDPEPKGKISETLDNVLNFFGKKKEDKEAGEKDENTEEIDGKEETAKNNTTAEQAKDGKNSTEKASKKSVIEKENLAYTIEWETHLPLTDSQKKDIKSIMRKMDAEDQARRIREEARNTLEGNYYKAREFMDDRDLEKISTAEQREALKKVLDETSEWMEDHAETAVLAELRKRLSALESLYDPMVLRKQELTRRPETIEWFEKSLKEAKTFVESVNATLAKQATEKENNETTSSDPEIWYPPDVISSLDKLVQSNKEWYKTNKEKQDGLKFHEDPVLVSKELLSRKETLDEAVRRAVSLKRVIPKPKSSKSTSTTTTTKASKEEEPQATPEPAKEQEPPVVPPPEKEEPNDEL